jgi:hypothetical protein
LRAVVVHPDRHAEGLLDARASQFLFFVLAYADPPTPDDREDASKRTSATMAWRADRRVDDGLGD